MIGVRTFALEPASIRAAREFVRDCVEQTGVDVDSAVLLTSELATNAVEHAHSAYQIEVRHLPDAVRVELSNDEPQMLPAMTEPHDTGGRGLHLVDALASRWGTESRPDKKVVWFELANGA
jgi:anti-sigma regulatory factor (Ser/Thr protein kinase)